MKTEETLRSQFEERICLQWNDNPFIQLNYERGIIESMKLELTNQNSNDEYQSKLTIYEENEKEMKINLITNDKFKQITIGIFVNGENQMANKKYRFGFKKMNKKLKITTTLFNFCYFYVQKILQSQYNNTTNLKCCFE